ncbi:MAG TPA: hypothetical protein VK043_11390 [Burkholderiales bacterium]|nr:hypothetical protein [Burkholderiales bacterium]
MQTRPCTRCRGETRPAVLENAASEADGIALKIERMPVLACSAGHLQFVSPEFPRWLVEHLIEEDEARLPAGREKGLLFKHYLCGDCGAELERTPKARNHFAFDVALRDLQPFRVELTAPVFRCPRCEREQLHSMKELQSRTPVALAEAFRAAQIPPA